MIIVSTSGFSYSDWQGRFYPADLKKTDQLEFFSGYFKAVELNYTFYAPPGEKGIAGHIRKAPGMKFAIKGHSSFTHKRNASDKDEGIYKAALDQLKDSNALLSLLLQFPYSFHANEKNFDYVKLLSEKFADYPVAIEFRHSKWKNEVVMEYFKNTATTLVVTDAPAMPNLFRGGWESTGSFSYVRLHGRNKEKWWEHEEGWERYNYLYNGKEIEGMAKAVQKLESPTQNQDPRNVYVFFNNHWQAQGAINALQLSAELGLETPENLPEVIKRKL